MITIIWKIEDITKRSDMAQVRRVSAIRLYKDGKVKDIGVRVATYEADFQNLMNLLQDKKALPAKAFETRRESGGHKYYYADALRDAKIANVVQI